MSEKVLLEKLIADYLEVLLEQEDNRILKELQKGLIGRTVTADVHWDSTGRITATTGKIISFHGDFVYLETSFGAVEANVHTMESAE